ncbi:hypothetical protein Taro_051872, partial [Colocasia esculenta]|nr:hypothetical protein [Colocasia esculenta]
MPLYSGSFPSLLLLLPSPSALSLFRIWISLCAVTVSSSSSVDLWALPLSLRLHCRSGGEKTSLWIEALVDASFALKWLGIGGPPGRRRSQRAGEGFGDAEAAGRRRQVYFTSQFHSPAFWIQRSTSYGDGSSQYPFMPIIDPSHTFHSASSSSHHVTEEHVIDDDEEDKIDSHDDIDDNENMDKGDDEPLFDIARVNNTEIEYEQDPPNIFTFDQWIDATILNNSHEGINVSCTLKGEEPYVGQIFTNKKNLIY